MIEAIQTYYQGEKSGALVGGTIALGFVLSGLYLILNYQGIFKGAGWPFLLVGALVSMFCFFYFRKLDSDLIAYSDLFQRRPEEYFAKELLHIVGALRSLRIALWTELSIILSAPIILIIANYRTSSVLSGIGIALVIVFACTAMLDLSNRERAMIYKESIMSHYKKEK